MKPDYIFWLALAAYALHILEEYTYDWKSWSRNTMKQEVDWSTFYVTNAVMLFFSMACAEVGWSHPRFSLIFPALIVVNALYSHILPYIRAKRKFSPGLITAIFLFLPIGLGSFKQAADLGVNTRSLLLAALGGIMLAAFPVFMQKTKSLDYFKP